MSGKHTIKYDTLSPSKQISSRLSLQSFYFVRGYTIPTKETVELRSLRITQKLFRNFSYDSRRTAFHASGKSIFGDRLCGLVFRVPGYRYRDPGFDSWRYQIFWEVVGMERGPLSLVSTTEELLGRNSSGSGLENREYGSGDPLRWPRDTLYPQKLTLTSPTSGGHWVGIVRLRTEATEFVLFCSFFTRTLA
jgi:hypothetical protein